MAPLANYFGALCKESPGNILGSTPSLLPVIGRCSGKDKIDRGTELFEVNEQHSRICRPDDDARGVVSMKSTFKRNAEESALIGFYLKNSPHDTSIVGGHSSKCANNT